MPPQVQTRAMQPVYGGNFRSDNAGPLSFVLPGELVAATANPAESSRILEPSPDRVTPHCAHFGACGGCQYQHADYAAQVALKSQILEGILRAHGLAALPGIPTRHAAPWEYRNRIRVRLEPASSGGAARLDIGYSRRSSNEFLPIRMCPIAAPLLLRAAERLLRIAEAEPACRRWLDSVAVVELFSNGQESRLQMQFFLREPVADDAGFSALCERLRTAIPELAGAGAELDPALNRRVRRRWNGIAWGAPGLNYEVADRTYWVSRRAFFQVNRFLIETLVHLVCKEQKGGLAWDLFAGVGLFSRVLAERFERVIAVEAGDAAAADLVVAGKGGKGKPAFEALHSSTLDFLRAQGLQRERPELIVLDPPRAGLGAEAAQVLARIGAPQLVYVSCDPTTLARDLAILTRGGYRIDTIDLIDLFPQTFHIETVVRLSRG